MGQDQRSKNMKRNIQSMRWSVDTLSNSVPEWEKEEFNMALWFLTWMILISHSLAIANFHVQLVTFKLKMYS